MLFSRAETITQDKSPSHLSSAFYSIIKAQHTLQFTCAGGVWMSKLEKEFKLTPVTLGHGIKRRGTGGNSRKQILNP